MIEGDNQRDLYAKGGDILMDRKGNIVYIYRSKSLDDRPSVQQLLQAIPNPCEGALNLLIQSIALIPDWLDWVGTKI